MAAVALLLTVSATLLWSGCEVDSVSDNNLRIDPATATLRINESREFTASGGFEYTWTLENEEWGTLSARTGNRVVYTSLYDPGAEAENARQVLTVSSTVESAAETNDNGSATYTQTAEAIITHRSVETDLAIEPPSARLQQWESATFTASGARTYRWSLANESWGSLTARTGPSTTYTSQKATASDALQTLICDTDEGRITAHIVHEKQEVTISPTTATLFPGDSLSLKASGGDQYVWSVAGGQQYPNCYDFSSAGNQAVITHIVGKIPFTNQAEVVVTVTSGGASANSRVTLSNQ